MQNARIHPLFLTAAVAVIITCAVAVASMTGLWPNSKAANSDAETQNNEALAMASLSVEDSVKNELSPVEAKPITTPLDAQSDNKVSSGLGVQENPKTGTELNHSSSSKTHKREHDSKSKIKSHESEFAAGKTIESAPHLKSIESRPIEVCHACGQVVDVRSIRIEPEGSGVGAVAGGVAGALLGKQFGNGNGQKALTVAGALGGALLGNKIEKDRRATTIYDVVVEFEDGSSQTFREGSGTSFQVGDKVKVANGQLTTR